MMTGVGREKWGRRAVLGRGYGNLLILPIVHFSEDRLDRKGYRRFCFSSAHTCKILQNFRFKLILDGTNKDAVWQAKLSHTAFFINSHVL